MVNNNDNEIHSMTKLFLNTPNSDTEFRICSVSVVQYIVKS